MPEHDEVYGEGRKRLLEGLLRDLAARIRALDADGRLLESGPDLLQLMGDIRSELFHYEVRSTYDTPEVAENRRIVEDALGTGLDFHNDEPEDPDPWRPPRPR